jgi:hypothetical protein
MSGGLLDSGRRAIRIALTTMVAGGLCVGCASRTGTADSPIPGVSGVAQCPTNGPPATPAELRECVRQLSFDTTELVGDEQRLMLNPPCPASCRYGPLAKIEPAMGAHEYSERELQDGRIIARLFVRRSEQGYPKLALVPGYITYWWVQKDATGRGGRSIFISEAAVGNRLMMTKPQSMEVEAYAEGTFKRAIARWLWLEDDETGKGTCGSATCTPSGPR